MHVQLHYLTTTNSFEIYSMSTDDMVKRRHRPHFDLILQLNVEERTVIGITKVDSIFNEQH